MDLSLKELKYNVRSLNLERFDNPVVKTAAAPSFLISQQYNSVDSLLPKFLIKKGSPVIDLSPEQKFSDLKEDLEIEKFRAPVYLLPLRHKKIFAVFSAVALTVIGFQLYSFSSRGLANIKLSLQDQTSGIQAHFTDGAKAFERLDFFQARQEFTAAAGLLADIRSKYLSGFNGIFIHLGAIFSNKIKDAPALLSRSQEAASAAADLSFRAQKADSFVKSIFITPQDSRVQNDSPIDFLKSAQDDIISILDSFRYLSSSGFIKNTEISVNGENKNIENMLIRAKDSIRVFAALLGSTAPKNYLVLFQNETEARATGGFIGSFGIARFSNGKLEAFRVHDTYDFDGQIENALLPPPPLRAITPVWGLRDANWFFNFPTSAKKTIELYSKSKLADVQIDGVIALDLSVIKRILELTGPIALSDYDMIIDDENFIAKIQEEVETGPAKLKNQPKKILGSFGEELVKKLSSLDQYRFKPFMTILTDALKQKDVLVYMNDPDAQKLAVENNWAGEVKNPSSDYLAVINSNIKGSKSDYSIKQHIDISASIKEGQPQNTLTVIREHNGDKEKLKWWRAVNYDYMRVYLPLGSEVIKSSGFKPMPFSKIAADENSENDNDVDLVFSTVRRVKNTNLETYIESGKTVVAGWVVTWPGSKSKISLTYQSPIEFKKDEDYKLMIQKQPGINSSLTFQFAGKNGTASSPSNKKELQLDKDVVLEP